MAVEVYRVDVVFGRHYENSHRWLNWVYGSFKADALKRPDFYDELAKLTERFIEEAGRKVWRDKMQHRMILKVYYRAEFTASYRKWFLVVRLVPNPNKVYKQMKGWYYPKKDKRMPVIGNDVLSGKFRLSGITEKLP